MKVHGFRLCEPGATTINGKYKIIIWQPKETSQI